LSLKCDILVSIFACQTGQLVCRYTSVADPIVDMCMECGFCGGAGCANWKLSRDPYSLRKRLVSQPLNLIKRDLLVSLLFLLPLLLLLLLLPFS
jgi:hypothetical protein